MKRITISLLIIVLFLFGCGNKEKEDNSISNNNTEEKETESVEVDEGLLDVTITLPNSFFESFDTTAEEYVNSMNSSGDNDSFKKVEINSDGSVSITMTKAKYKEFMTELAKSLDDSLQEIINSDDYTFTAIEHDSKFENFKVELSTNEMGLKESFMVIAFGMYGGIYQLFDGNENPHVVVKYIGSDGTELLNWDSIEAAKK